MTSRCFVVCTASVGSWVAAVRTDPVVSFKSVDSLPVVVYVDEFFSFSVVPTVDFEVVSIIELAVV